MGAVEPAIPTPPPPRPRVKDLAKRFETGVDVSASRARTATSGTEPQKRIGKFRVNDQGQMYRVSQMAPTVRVGVVRKKSSLNKRSKSTYDINQNRKDDSLIRKSSSLQSDLCEENDRTASIPIPRTVISNAVPSGATVTLPVVPRPLPSPPCQRPVPAARTTTPSPRPRTKPPPPCKPTRLFTSDASSATSGRESVVSTTSRECIASIPASLQDPLEGTSKDPEPVYRERAAVTLNINSKTLPRPRQAPPAPPQPPPQPPSRERINRIPSYRSSAVDVVRVRRASSSDDDEIYQKMSSPEQETPPIMQSSLSVRLTSHGKPKDIPRIPTIPLPTVPAAFEDLDELYEEIESPELIRLRERLSGLPPSSSGLPSSSSGPPQNTSELPSTSCGFFPSSSGDAPQNPVSPNYSGSQSSELSSNYVTNIYCGDSPPPPTRRFSHRSGRSLESEDVIRGDVMSASTMSFQTMTLHRNKKPRRPVSTLEFDKLLKFKSDLQLNISKKVGQLRQKVRKPNSTKFYPNDNSSEIYGVYGNTHSETYNDLENDQHIYGDDWSSEEEDQEDVGDRRSSMYKELEAQLNKAFPKMSSESEYESADTVAPTSLEDPRRPADLPISRLTLQDDRRPSLDEPSPDYDYSRQYTSRLTDGQPLYQIYLMAEQEKLIDDVSANVGVNEETPEKERVIKSRRESTASSDSGRGADCSTSASALTSNTSMRRERLIATSLFGSQRSLWCELPEVKSAGLLESLDEETKLRQEAYFEVITSEASYLRSLNILITHFMASPELLGSKSSMSVISNAERKHLFSNIFAVRDCSERLLSDLETRLGECLVLDDVCDILLEHFEQHFDVYVKYCSNQIYQDRTLRRLKTENGVFLTAVSKMESHKDCQGLDMRSFLMLPMQRITRYPLLMYAIIDRLSLESEKYQTASKALNASSKVVRECNEGARRMERTEQLLEVDRRLVYNDPDLKRIPLVSNSRHLVKKGSLIQLVERRNKGILQTRQKTRSVHVFLFSDIIMITKKKLNGTYVCKDYAARRYVDVEPLEADNAKIPSGGVSVLTSRPHLFHCVLMRNARGRQTELLLNAESETDRERWLSAIRPPTSLNPEEKIYAEWDCPQAIAVHNYAKAQDDEMELSVGDVINILRKMPDGWYFGERCRDAVGGWFPSSYVEQILNDHVRANNYRQRLRLIQAASGGMSRVGGRPSGTPIMDRLRRMSNPRTFFQSGVGL